MNSQKLLSPEAIEAIRNANPIRDVIAESLQLNRANVGLCPFHRENTPSFHVSAKRQRFHCFGCSVDGDVFEFIAKQAGCTFRQAVIHLAKRAGIAVEGFSPSPELSARVKRERAQRAEIEHTEQVLSEAYDILAARERMLGRAAALASQCLAEWTPANKFPELQELAWAAINRYQQFQAAIERERIFDRDVMLAELASLKGRT